MLDQFVQVKDKGPMVVIDREFFFQNKPNPPHKGWTLAAFQDYCREQLIAAGFNLKVPLKVVYDPVKKVVVFWQEYVQLNYSYSLN